MCGIGGIVTDEPGKLRPGDLELLGKALAHRGPDGEGQWFSASGAVGLVHRRLAIIDTSSLGDQPMVSPEGRYVIVYNGEIFNFLELRRELTQLGAAFRGESDTEVVLAAWRVWGPAMLQRFNGMWALAILDTASGDLFLARDRFGIKPLLYASTSGRFAFASEVRALRSLPWVGDDINKDVARRLLFDPFSVEGSDRTLYSSIQRLPAGHYGIIRAGSLELSVRRWWKTVDHLPAVPSDEAEAAEGFLELFRDSIRLRMRSDVPIGTCLSGGFDSTAIACEMASLGAAVEASPHGSRAWRHAFVASFPGESNDETPEAVEAARWAGIAPQIVPSNNLGTFQSIDAVLADLDDVYIGLPKAPWEVYRQMRAAGVVVSLDGHGADELMGGYRTQGDTLGYILRNQVDRLSRSRAGAAATDAAKSAWLAARGLNFLRGFKMLAPAPVGIVGLDDELPAEWGALNRRLYAMFHHTVLPTILRNFDRLSMAHGIEVRMPFLDWRLVTYTMALPDRMKTSQGFGKWIGRVAMKGRMPEGIRMNRRKVGFNSPMPAWMSGPLRAWVLDTMARPNELFSELVDERQLRARVQEYTALGRWTWHNVGRVWPYLHLRRVLSSFAW